MATLIDDLFSVQVKIGHRWFIAKPIVQPFIKRIKDAWKVLTGRYEAVKFAEMEYKKSPTWRKNTRFTSPLDLEKAKEVAAEKMAKKVFGGKINSFGDLKVGANEKCPCNSGKKFKKCHGKVK